MKSVRGLNIMIGKRYGMQILHSYRPFKNIVPEGLILPYQGGEAAPTGWDLYAAANDCYIMGAGDIYAVDETDATHNDIVYTTNNSTLHGGTTFGCGGNEFGAPGTNGSAGTSDKYTGTHAVTVEDFEPGTEQLVFIKSQQDQNKCPQDALVLGIQDFSGLTVVKDNARLLKAGATITSVAAQTTDSVTSSASGNHDHRTTEKRESGEGGAYAYLPAGNHTHTIGMALTAQIKRYYLSAWTNAAADFKSASGIIGMFESLTPPMGWYLCDGDNGTPDLRNYFIQLDSAANDNQDAGDNTVNGTVSSCSSSGGHHHKGSAVSSVQSGTLTEHSNSAGAHDNHTIAVEDIEFIPPYFALAFIMKG